jgi:hypothetical protein
MKKLFIYTSILSCFIIPVSCLTSLQPLVTEGNIVTDNRITGRWIHDEQVIDIESMASPAMIKKADHKSSWRPGKNDPNSFRTYDMLVEKNGIREFMKNTISGDGRSISGSMQKSKDLNDSIFFSKTYSVVFEQKGIRHVMTGALTRINNNLFFELMPVFINDPENPDGVGYEYAFDYLGTFTIGKIAFDKNALTLQFLNSDFIREQIDKGTMRIKHEKDKLFDTFLITASTADMQQFLMKYGNDDRLFDTKNSITLTRKG